MMATNPKHSSYPDRLKWAEEQGAKNLGEKFSTADNMNKEAQTTLTYVLAAMGITFAYVFGKLELDAPLKPLVAASAIMCVYYTSLGIYLVWRTLFIGDYPAPYQEPKNLIKDEYVALDEVREGEIRRMTKSIDDSKKWIEKKSRAINQVRAFLVASPIAFVVAIFASKCLV